MEGYLRCHIPSAVFRSMFLICLCLRAVLCGSSVHLLFLIRCGCLHDSCMCAWGISVTCSMYALQSGCWQLSLHATDVSQSLFITFLVFCLRLAWSRSLPEYRSTVMSVGEDCGGLSAAVVLPPRVHASSACTCGRSSFAVKLLAASLA